jgi:electron transfer flavoprotein alpha subunit
MKNNDVLIWGEVIDGELNPKTFELMGIGRKLADGINGKLLLVLMGGNLSEACKQLDTFGADRIFRIEGSDYEPFNADSYLEAYKYFCKTGQPGILIMAHSQRAMEIAPRLSVLLKTILTTDCIGLEIDPEDGLLRRTKPPYGGNTEAIYKYAALPQFVTVRGGIFPPAKPGSTRSEVITVEINMKNFSKKIESPEFANNQITSNLNAEFRH